ncbi:PREDICTED: uncharacterized protein LOC109159462 [Ipomoea nil]|uniref:uncharacterized protein LOC109159462 n=1 Tax=Ipomoea nil TaxID=35883 RepID=UPI0009014B40|nr:PREDICTED: uncharacterized protein LOC109159462 [Ipomoea nil]
MPGRESPQIKHLERRKAQTTHQNTDWRAIGDLFPEIGHNCEKDESTALRSQNPCVAEVNLKENCPIVTLSKIDWGNLVKAEEKVSLIGRFVGERPSMDSLRTNLRTVLRLDGDLQVGSLNQRNILLRFSSESDCRRTWMRNQIAIGNGRLWLSRWKPEQNINPSRDSPFSLVWFQLPLLPVHLFEFEVLSRICKPIGKLVELDSATIRRSRPSIARVRIEIDASKPTIDCLLIEYVGEGGGVEGFWQKFVAERMPIFCSTCGRFGHSQKECRRRGGAEIRPVRLGRDVVETVDKDDRAHKCPETVRQIVEEGLESGKETNAIKKRNVDMVIETARKIELSALKRDEGKLETFVQSAAKAKMDQLEADLATKADEIIMETVMGLADEIADKVLKEDDIDKPKAMAGEEVSKNKLTELSMKDLCKVIETLSSSKRKSSRKKEVAEKVVEGGIEVVGEEAELVEEAALKLSRQGRGEKPKLESLNKGKAELSASPTLNVTGNQKEKESGDLGLITKPVRDDREHRSFVVNKEAWEEAKQDIFTYMSKVKKEMGLQEFEKRKGEIVQRTKDLYLNKLKGLAKNRGVGFLDESAMDA